MLLAHIVGQLPAQREISRCLPGPDDPPPSESIFGQATWVCCHGAMGTPAMTGEKPGKRMCSACVVRLVGVVPRPATGPAA